MRNHITLILAFLLSLSFKAHAINPDKNYNLTPSEIGWDYEELRIKTTDNQELNTWVYAPNPAVDRQTILILASHDYGNMSYFVYHAATLANRGFTVVTFDYRGFGKSSDFEINRSNIYYLEFSKDLAAVVNEISKKFSGKKVGVWGLSMGTIVASKTYPEIKGKIDFMVGDGFVTDTAYIVDRYRTRGKDLVLPEPAPAYAQSVAQIEIPLLIFAASKDEITTTSDALELKEKLGKTCEIVEYEGEHLQGFQYKIDEKGFGMWYVEQLNNFISGI